ncbi:MAG: methyltransferase domain-containing protein [Candidatus Bathyarchaeota archaeon]|nr:methyltransferase domain-containing protein [Candidatus Bathyarchaeota archaeon]MDH5779478.1 methyltransferase domain-containing protein [Candidatus Bathyarchaeota archaeon]
MMKKGLAKKRYNRIAAVYDSLESPMELLSYSRWRKEVFKWIPKKGTILEVGVGTGKNLSNYHKNHEVFAIDISENMLQRAKSRAEKSRALIHLAQMDAERLAFPDRIFDAAISTYVFYSVENPLKGLKEIERSLKPEGIVVFLEHMRSENEFLGKAMDLLNPLVVNAFGPNINRHTVENIRKVGFEILEEEYLLSSIFRIIVAKPQVR